MRADELKSSLCTVLGDLRVLDFSSEIAGPYCSKLLADAGADVIKVEGPGGDPLRRRSASGALLGDSDGALFRYLNTSKRSVVTRAMDDTSIKGLLSSADVVVESGAFPLAIDVLRESFPHLVVVSLTPFGHSGPWSGRPATDFTLQAESGAISVRGRYERPPVQAGGRIHEWAAGAYGAVGALAALEGRARSGCGEHVDISLLEVAHLAGTGHSGIIYQLTGEPPATLPIREIEAPSVEPTADGLVGFMTVMPSHFTNFLLMIERADLIDDELWFSKAKRLGRLDEWNLIVRAWTTRHTTEEIVDLSRSLRVPVAEVTNGRTVLDQEQFRYRNIFVESPDGTFVQPLPPFTFSGVRAGIRSEAPTLGQDSGRIEISSRSSTQRGEPEGQLPFAGLRIVDVTNFWAGPLVGEIFAVFGADVIKLESIAHFDGGRASVGPRAEGSWWERGAVYVNHNHDKRSLTLELDTPEGRDAFYRVLAKSDVLVENYSPRVFDNFGIDWAEIHERNPRLIFLRLPAFGLDGPWRENLGFAQIMEEVTGLAWVTGYEDQLPLIMRGVCDPIAGLHATFGLMVALRERERTGVGELVEIAMAESILNVAAEPIVEYSAYGKILERHGNRGPDAAPQGLYPCAGSENWLALAVSNDHQWAALLRVMGEPAWAKDPRFRSGDGRRLGHDEIDREVSTWTSGLDLHETVERLVTAGVPAGSVRDVRFMADHPQLLARGFYEEIDHPTAGRHYASVLPFHFQTVPRWSRRPAPLLGEHNFEILKEVAGLSEGEILELERIGVIGRRPANID